MGAVKLTMETSGAQTAEGCEKRTGRSTELSRPRSAQSGGGIEMVPRITEEREGTDFEPAPASDAIRGELELWGAVLLQAIEDYHRKGSGYEVAVNGIRLRGWYYDREIRGDKRRAEAWFKSKSLELGSYLWICDLLGLDPERVWARIRQRGFVLTPQG